MAGAHRLCRCPPGRPGSRVLRSDFWGLGPWLGGGTPARPQPHKDPPGHQHGFWVVTEWSAPLEAQRGGGLQQAASLGGRGDSLVAREGGHSGERGLCGPWGVSSLDQQGEAQTLRCPPGGHGPVPSGLCVMVRLNATRRAHGFGVRAALRGAVSSRLPGVSPARP